MITPEIRRLVTAYRQALDNLSREAHQPGAYYQGRPEPEVEHADALASAAARELAEALIELDERHPEDPGEVHGIAIQITDVSKSARKLWGPEGVAQFEAEITHQPMPATDYRFDLRLGSGEWSSRTSMARGASWTAEEIVRYATERYAERGLWLCGCLVNDGGAHRVGCPDHPEGVRGDRS